MSSFDLLEDRVAPAALYAVPDANPLADTSPVVQFLVKLTNLDGQELRADSTGRYTLIPNADFLAKVYVDDLRPNGDLGGVFAAYADLTTDANGVLDFQSIDFGPGFTLDQTSTLGSSGVLGAGAVRDSLAAPGSDPAQLLFTIRAHVATDATNGTVLILDLESGESLPGRRNLVFGSEVQALGAFQDAQAVVLTNPWTNPDELMDVTGDGRVNARDLLTVVNARLRYGGDFELGLPTSDSAGFVDVNSDGSCDVADMDDLIQAIRSLFATP